MGRAILVTGGTGKTGHRVAAQLRARGHEPRIASRGGAAGTSRFEWSDATTFDDALRDVVAIYLVAPSNVSAPLEAMRPFLDVAMARGVARFVLLSASSLEEGGPMMGAVHAHLKAHARQWAALRPTWFMQNFSEHQHLHTIRDGDEIVSATEDGRVAFVDAEDIAAVAVEALTQPSWTSREIVITGPETLSYDDVASQISRVAGRTITHRRVAEREMASRFEHAGMAAPYASMLAAMDTAIAAGAEDRVSREVERITGRAPRSFATFAEDAREVWRTT